MLFIIDVESIPPDKKLATGTSAFCLIETALLNKSKKLFFSNALFDKIFWLPVQICFKSLYQYHTLKFHQVLI